MGVVFQLSTTNTVTVSIDCPTNLIQLVSFNFKELPTMRFVPIAAVLIVLFASEARAFPSIEERDESVVVEDKKTDSGYGGLFSPHQCFTDAKNDLFGCTMDAAGHDDCSGAYTCLSDCVSGVDECYAKCDPQRTSCIGGISRCDAVLKSDEEKCAEDAACKTAAGGKSKECKTLAVGGAVCQGAGSCNGDCKAEDVCTTACAGKGDISGCDTKITSCKTTFYSAITACTEA